MQVDWDQQLIGKNSRFFKTAGKEAWPTALNQEIAVLALRCTHELGQRSETPADGREAKLGNEKFVANAPEEVIDEQREKREEAEARKAKILEALERLKGAE